MKKWIGLFLLLILLFLTCVYVFIPSKIKVSSVRYVTCYQGAGQKFITDPDLFASFLQKKAVKKGNAVEYQHFRYTLIKALSNITEIHIESEDVNVTSHLISLNVYLDSSAIQWSTELEAGFNPISRIKKYTQATALKKSMEGLMDALKQTLDHSENIYGIGVKEIQFADSVLITTRFKTNNYPDTKKVYEIITHVKNYVAQENAIVIDSPMLFVQKTDATYESMIGLPINKVIAEKGDMKIKRIPYMGNMLLTEIKGGPDAIKNGFDKLTEYFFDSKRQSPAIPFQMLMTNRITSTDSSKWITRIYYPVM